MISYGTVCSGIGAPELAVRDLGWKCGFMSEIEKFPRAVLRHHFPDHPLHGDFITIQRGDYADVNVLIGGTPCQDFSVAGKRLGLDAPRGNLALEYLALARRLGTQWLVWENVPGMLSSWSDEAITDSDTDFLDGRRELRCEQRNDFATFLSFVGECGFGYAWRVLDGANFGSAMSRRRIILIGYIGDWRPAAAVLFEREAITKGRESFSGIPSIDASGLAKKQTMPERGRCWTIHDGAGHRFLTPVEVERLFGFPDDWTNISHKNLRKVSSRKVDRGVSQATIGNAGAPFVVQAVRERESAANEEIQAQCGNAAQGESIETLRIDHGAVRGEAGGTRKSLCYMREGDKQACSGSLPQNGQGARDFMPSLQYNASSDRGCAEVEEGISISKTPRIADGPRYKALGNSMIVGQMRWVLDRLDRVQKILEELKQ